MSKKLVERNVREGMKEGRKGGGGERRGSDKCAFERDDENGRLKKVTSGMRSKGES